MAVADVIVPAVVGGVVAYVTTWAQTRGEIRKMRVERDELHYSHRQANYHNLQCRAEDTCRAAGAAKAGRPGGLALDQGQLPRLRQRRDHLRR
jgi:hypothetical protein